MENHAQDPIIVLKIEIGHEECSETLEKQFFRIDGVHQVAINREKKEVTIIGDVDPLILVKYIAKSGKRVQLVLYDKKPKTDQGSRDKHPNGDNLHAGQTSRERYSGCPDDHTHYKMNDSFHHGKYHPAAKDDKYRAAAKESEEEMCQDQHGQFYSVHNDKYRTAPGKKVEEETFRDPYGQFHSVHTDKYGAAAKGVEEEMCHDQYVQFRERSKNSSNGFVPLMKNEGAKCYSCPDHHPHCKMEDYVHQEKYRAAEEMNRGRYGQFYGRSRSTNEFARPRNSEDANYYSFSDDHPRCAAPKGVEEEMSRSGYGQFHGRNRKAGHGFVPTRYNEDMCGNPKDHPDMMADASREAKIEEAIKEARKDMDLFFNIRRRVNDHFARGSPGYHHISPNTPPWIREEPPPDDHYNHRNAPPPTSRGPMPDFEFREGTPPFELHHGRMPPPPPSPEHVYRGIPGSHYDKFTNLFSDENPSSCTII